MSDTATIPARTPVAAGEAARTRLAPSRRSFAMGNIWYWGIAVRTHIGRLMILALLCSWGLAVERRHSILVGVVLKLDYATKTAVVKTADGTEHAFHFVGRTTVHGLRDTAAGGRDAFHGLKEGTLVAVHYTGEGAEDTADEVDNIGKDGLKSAEVTVVHIDRGARTIGVKATGGVEETYHLTDNAAKDVGSDIAKGGEKTGHVTLYYGEEAGHKVVHFVRWAF